MLMEIHFTFYNQLIMDTTPNNMMTSINNFNPVIVGSVPAEHQQQENLNILMVTLLHK